MANNEIVYDSGFLKDVKKLPRQIQKKLAELITILAKNPFDHSLHTKPLAQPLEGKYSFRITRDWRVCFYFRHQNSIHLLAVDHRNKIYQRMQKL